MIAKEREYATITLILPKMMWSSVEIVKKMEGKKKEVRLGFIVEDRESLSEEISSLTGTI